ncbi:EVE domain-containing protein [Pleionea sediminis]|uniref:EVE domain-containing protein n=1 Tax=Pleionea sediminis TaxID=2569479 RepID=UPI001184B116|nr:EVE domain-containing protein [Pleionea sediminis]
MNYWLLKTEPDEFSIDDLEKIAPRSERWNGIRNYQARNIIRDEIKIDDLAFIYHSSCKNVGIAGIAKVTRSAYIDEDQFDSNSAYFDIKSNRENPRWYCFDVAFIENFNSIITLKQLKSDLKLLDMVLIKQGRLSIQPVKKKEWDHIITYSN